MDFSDIKPPVIFDSRKHFASSSIACEQSLLQVVPLIDDHSFDRWLRVVWAYGLAGEAAFNYVEPEIIKAPGRTLNIVRLRPWKDHLDRGVSGATAHGCAANFLASIAHWIFKDPNSICDLSDWIRSNRDELQQRLRDIDAELDYSEVVALAASVRLERLLLEEMTAPLSPKDSRNKFCFEQWQNYKTLKEIRIAVSKHAEWEHLTDDASVRGPIQAWGRAIGVKPRKGSPGPRRAPK